ncbi:hypothetical protein BGZ63DRAFT_13499 [Mariannaea sp. PMI_226]|nr:hypothetical protein BGZ63DRAFT_13499 [Mariannaea sp. PMI_226]
MEGETLKHITDLNSITCPLLFLSESGGGKGDAKNRGPHTHTLQRGWNSKHTIAVSAEGKYYSLGSDTRQRTQVLHLAKQGADKGRPRETTLWRGHRPGLPAFFSLCLGRWIIDHPLPYLCEAIARYGREIGGKCLASEGNKSFLMMCLFVVSLFPMGQFPFAPLGTSLAFTSIFKCLAGLGKEKKYYWVVVS